MQKLLFTLLIMYCTKQKKEMEKPTFFPAKVAAIEEKYSWEGSVRAANRIELRASKKTKIAKVLVTEGQKVKKGQLLIEVDTTDEKKKQIDFSDKLSASQIDIKSAELSLNFAEKVSKRKQTLAAKGIVPQKDLDEAQKQFETALSAKKSKDLELQKLHRDADAAQKEMKSANLYAPLDGIVSNLAKADPYSELRPGQTLAMISDPTHLAFYTEIEENFISRLKINESVDILLDSFPGKAIKGKISSVNLGSAEGATSLVNKYQFVAAFDGNGLAVQDGFRGKVEVVFQRKDKALLVPLSALKLNDGSEFLLVSSSPTGTGKPVAVKTGIKNDLEVEILQGLSENQFVMVETK